MAKDPRTDRRPVGAALMPRRRRRVGGVEPQPAGRRGKVRMGQDLGQVIDEKSQIKSGDARHFGVQRAFEMHMLFDKAKTGGVENPAVRIQARAAVRRLVRVAS